REAADGSRAELSEVVKESDMVFITAGMGGGTGTGSASIVAQQAKEQGALTIGVVTRPFAFEGRIRNDSAEEGIKALRSQVDALIVIPNDTMQGEIKITVIATGFAGKTHAEARQTEARKTVERPEFGTEDMGDINIPAFLRNRM